MVSCLVVGGFLLSGAAGGPCLAADDKPQDASPSAAPKRKPLVVMKQTEIKGRVFLIGDKGEEAVPAPDILIEVRLKTEEKLLHRTTTDRQGNYTLPSLAVDLYAFKVGLLNLELRVESPEKEFEGKKPIPKMIFVFLPQELAKEEKRVPPEKHDR